MYSIRRQAVNTVPVLRIGVLLLCYSRSLRHRAFYSTESNAADHPNKESDKETVNKPVKSDSPKKINHNSLFVISVPITTHRSYIYCNHKSSLLDSSQTKTVPQIVHWENKIVGLATKAWHKLTESEMSINKRVVSLVRKLLNTIPYSENSLRSFPSKRAMVREINQEHFSELPRLIMTSEVEAGKFSLDQLKPIPVYHPRFQDPQAILDQLIGTREKWDAYHRKWALLCGLGVPLTLPLAVVPVVPNVPGFYLAYRCYCHIKASMGAHNLGYLLECASDDPSVEDTTHLVFKACPELDVPFLADATFAKVRSEDSDEDERILIGPETIDRLVESLELHHLREDLHKALSQESARIQKEMAGDPVE